MLLIPANAVGGASTTAAHGARSRVCLQEVRAFSDVAALLGEFQVAARRSAMGTRLYVAGPESFIGLAMKLALEFNLNKDEIRAEEMGSLARRGVLHSLPHHRRERHENIVRCRCALRDHSRRLAPYGRDGGC